VNVAKNEGKASVDPAFPDIGIMIKKVRAKGDVSK
jgi:hypothetical protein